MFVIPLSLFSAGAGISEPYMIADFKNLPLIDETPCQFADRLAIAYSKKVSDDHKKTLGQFFTPLSVAKVLADFARFHQPKVRILDPGCGIGMLSAVLCEKAVSGLYSVREIELVAFETDTELLPYAEQCLTYLGVWLKKHEVDFTYFLCKNDFVLHNSHVLNNELFNNEDYDIIISNPPYFKLPKGDIRVEASRSVIHGQTNIYSIFMIIAARLLKANGQLIFITPRSFCSGSSFRVFRERFFSIIELDTIHVFNSRNTAFKRDKVLQENIIVVAKRKHLNHPGQMRLALEPESCSTITISASEGVDDFAGRRIKFYPTEVLLNMQSYQKILHLPISETDEEILQQFRQWSGSLHQYGLEISTGPVVDFRSMDFIVPEKRQDAVPLLWLHNVRPMQIIWPAAQEKGKTKEQFIRMQPASMSRLVKNRNYVLLRRFSSKDDKNRLIAAPFLRKNVPWADLLGIENHLNYIYHKNRELSIDEIFGIAVIFNSRLFDLYFRTFNGNINVSATELRDFPLPEFEQIRSLGKKAVSKMKKNMPIDADNLFKTVFKLNLVLPNA